MSLIMKDSGIEYIGEIPEEWDIQKIKTFSDIFGRIGFRGYTVSDLVDEGEGAITLSPSNIENQKLTLDNVQYLSWFKYEESPEIKIFNGDILLVKTASVGKVAFVENLNEPATINPQFVVFKDIKINSKYFYYCLISSVIQTQIELSLNGGVVLTLTQQNIGNYYCPIPDKKTQENIVKFLDKIINSIDNEINKLLNLIEQYEEYKQSLITETITYGLNDFEMKECGVDFIDPIPKHWEVKKIKYISEVKPSNVDKKSKDYETPVKLCNYTDVYYNEFITNNLDFMKATASDDEIRKFSLKLGDIIITKDSESPDDIAIPAIVTDELDNVVCGYHLSIIRPNLDVINPKFLFRLLQSNKINKQFELSANGVTRFGLGVYPIKNAYVPIPPLIEQESIVKYLDKKCNPINSLILEKENLIEKMEEYKKSLIFEYVTGKKEVPK